MEYQPVTEEPIRVPYLLLTFVPFYVDDNGDIWLEALWHQDLTYHFNYLDRLTLAAPCHRKFDDLDLDLRRISPPSNARFSVVALPRMDSFLGTLLRLPVIAKRLWVVIGRTEILHSGLVGWPIPLGWIANPIARVRRKKLLLYVESADWRMGNSCEVSWKNRLREKVTEWLGRYFVNRADLTFFTQSAYMESLMTNPQGQGVVVAASWITAKDIIEQETLDTTWEKKNNCEVVRCIFASRLVERKGVRTLLAAMRALEAKGMRIRVDIVGAGPLRQECMAMASLLRSVECTVLEPVEYGETFWGLLRGYHAVLIPTLTDEQPRIIYDAFSQGVPVIASDTDGNRLSIESGRTGLLASVGDHAALASLLERAAGDIALLHRMGSAARAEARAHTHEVMHETRRRMIQEVLLESRDETVG